MKAKKVIAALAVAAMTMSLIPMSAFAYPEPEAMIGEAHFNTLQEALEVANANPGSVVDVVKDCTYNATMLTSADVTINLNGHTIGRDSSEVRWYVGKVIEEPSYMGIEDPTREELPKVVLNGPGNLINGETCDFSTDVYTPLLTVEYADFEMNDVYMYDEINYDDASAFDVREHSYVVVNHCNITGNSAVKIYRTEGYGYTEVEINDSILNCICRADTNYNGNGILAKYTNMFDTKLTVNDTVIRSENTAAVGVSSYFDMTFNNCTLTGPTGIYMKAGSVELNDTLVVADGEYHENVTFGQESNSTLDVDGDPWDSSGIIIDSDSKYDGSPVQVTISGDSMVISRNGYGIREVGGYDNESIVNVENNGTIIAPLGEVRLFGEEGPEEYTEEAAEEPAEEEAAEEPAEEAVEEPVEEAAEEPAEEAAE